MGGCGDAASNATTIIIYSLGGSIQDSTSLWRRRPIVLCSYVAPFSHFYAARLINCCLPLAPALARIVRPARSHTSQGGHVALLARSQFRGRPPTPSGADVRYALTTILFPL